MNPQKTELPAGDILTPSPAFNTLFIALHAFQHYGSGLALHHLCDWAVILKNYGLNIPDTITGTKLLKGFAALTFLCNKYLGTNIQITGDDDISQSMLDEILSPKYSENNPPKNKIGVLIYKTKRLLYNHKIKNSILTMSLSKRIFSSVVAHIRNPKSIFN
jgi:hypothetical protein